MKTTIMLEVDIPAGYEATGEFREPDRTSDEAIISVDGSIELVSSLACRTGPRIILRKTWTPPAWLKEGTWIAMDSNGEWFSYVHEPYCTRDDWIPMEQSSPDDILLLSRTMLDFTPPPCTDWRQSKQKIHHAT